MYRAIDTYKKDQSAYFSLHITRKIIQYYSSELRKLNNKQEYKNREIQQLAIRMINGDIDAQNKIIEFYTFHITKLVRNKYHYINYEEKDLVQIGIMGLLKVMNLYKLNQNHPFSTYANTYIKKEIENELKLVNKTPNIEYVGLTITDNKLFDDFIENTEVKEAIEKLSDVKKKILFLYTYGKYSFKDIGNMFGFSQQRAQEHYKHSIELIKKELNLPSEKQKKL
jgi:RNA polymerase sigma factor (sigma-70 family)